MFDPLTKNSDIHPTAIIAPEATIGEGSIIGPYCVIGPAVTIGKNVRLHSHVNIEGATTIGDETEVFPFASLGTDPQDLKYKGEKSRLVIGKRNKIREHVTMNTGTADDRMETKIGDDCLFMMATHVAHDCVVGNNVIMANNATLGGHVELGNFVIVGGLSAVKQFIKVGDHAMIGGFSAVDSNVLPYSLIRGERASLHGLNLVGLERRGFDKKNIKELRDSYRMIFNDPGILKDKLQKVLTDFPENELVQAFANFALNSSKQGICQPREA